MRLTLGVVLLCFENLCMSNAATTSIIAQTHESASTISTAPRSGVRDNMNNMNNNTDIHSTTTAQADGNLTVTNQTSVTSSASEDKIWSSTQALRGSPHTGPTTAKAAAPEWEYVSLGLIAVLGVCFIVIIVTCTCLLKMRRKLNKCNTTLYPVSATGDEKDVTSGRKQRGVKVELTGMTRNDGHDEDVIDSPTFPSSPSLPRAQLMSPGSHTDVKEAPPLPNRAIRRALPMVSHSSNSKHQSTTSMNSLTAFTERKHRTSNESNTNAASGIDNSGFEDDLRHRRSIEIQSNGRVQFESSGLYEDQDEENLYEEYENMKLHRYNSKQNLESGVKDNTGDDNGVYEEPNNVNRTKGLSATKDYLQKQNSMSGLPGQDLNRTASAAITSSLPLQVSDALKINRRPPDVSGLHGIKKTQLQPSNEYLDTLNNYDDLTTILPSKSTPLDIDTGRRNHDSTSGTCDVQTENINMNQQIDEIRELEVYENEPLEFSEDEKAAPFPNPSDKPDISMSVLAKGTFTEEKHIFDNTDTDMYEDYEIGESFQSVCAADISRIQYGELSDDTTSDRYANTGMYKPNVIEIYAQTCIEEPGSDQINRQKNTVSSLIHSDAPSREELEGTETMAQMSSPTGEKTQKKQIKNSPSMGIWEVSDRPPINYQNMSAPNYTSPDMLAEQFDHDEELLGPPDTPPPELPIEPPPPLPNYPPPELPTIPPRRDIMAHGFNVNESIGSFVTDADDEFGVTDVQIGNNDRQCSSGIILPRIPSPVSCGQMHSKMQSPRDSYFLDMNDKQHELIESGEIDGNKQNLESNGDVVVNEIDQIYDIPKKIENWQ